MKDPDRTRTVAFPMLEADKPPPDAWLDEELLAGEHEELGTGEHEPSPGRAVTFTSLGNIGAALKRSTGLLCVAAVIGVVLGFGLYAKDPPAYQATTSVLLTGNPTEDPGAEILNDLALAHSQAVAARVVTQLGLDQSVASLLAAYTVTDPSDQVIVFTVGAPSSSDALRRVSALATNFLQFRASYLQGQQQIAEASLSQQVSQARQRVDSLNQQISRASAQPKSAGQQADLTRLRQQLDTASQALTAAQQTAGTTLATSRTTTATMIQGSKTLDAPAALPHGLKKSAAFYILVAVFLALVIGAAIVIVREFVSDRLRRRDDIAAAIGAPVKLSLGAATGPGHWPGRGGRTSKNPRDVRRFVRHLDDAVAQSSGRRRRKCLAVIAVDNAAAVAPVIVSAAVTTASQGKRVVVADLSGYAARRLGVKVPGVHQVSAHGADFVLVTPEPDDIAFAGPLRGSRGGSAPVPPDLAAAWSAADVLLTLTTLDPATGGDYLSTWAADTVAVVTAGKSSWVRINAVGEMIRDAGARLASVVVLGADKGDESLGMLSEREDQSIPVLKP